MSNKLILFIFVFVLIYIQINAKNNKNLQKSPNNRKEFIEQYLNHLKNLKRVKREFYGSLPSYQQLNEFLDGITGWVPRHDTYYGPPAGGR
ncbi:unnamed protein product [Meloidogyne enterolobii]|uniref:Uncharacterized protein n=1 Tax=Meloidogyne enterolobii TaxID=390850 RepID=A0ACB0ZJ57_MELEN